MDSLEAVNEPDYEYIRKLFMTLVTQEDIDRDDLGFFDDCKTKDGNQ